MHIDFTLSWGNLASVGTFITILTFGVKALKYLRECQKSLGVVYWEHKVMWDDWRKKNEIPIYPYLRTEGDGKHVDI